MKSIVLVKSFFRVLINFQLSQSIYRYALIMTLVAVMSRPVAGVRNKSIIITLPGSPKGAKENLLSILKQLPHACKQAAGEDSRIAHTGGVRALEEQAGIETTKLAQSHHEHHEHHHSHHHSSGHGHGHHTAPKTYTSNDPTEGPAQRSRESQYPMISDSEALKLVLEYTPHPQVVRVPVNGNLVGCVLAENVQADEPVPAFRASIMDGYAVVVTIDNTNSKGTFPVTFVSHASTGDAPFLQPGQIARITTGAPLPPGATSVVKVELTRITQKTVTEIGEEETNVEILKDNITPGENVREIGSDVKAGETVLRKGEVITAVGGELGLLASVGKQEVSVYRSPVVGVLSTGDEIVPHDRPGSLRLGEVRDTNRPTVMAAVQGWGFEVIDLGIATDK